MRFFLSQLNPILGDFAHNTRHILQAIDQAKKTSCDCVVFPEMAICGYNPEDLLLESGFLESVESALLKIVKASSGISVIVGTVRENFRLPGKPMSNAACIISDGEIVGFQEKCLLPTYDVFDEWRYFEPAKAERVWELGGKKIGLTICEDIWPDFDQALALRYADDPLEYFQGQRLDLLVNISASPYSQGKSKLRIGLAHKVAKKVHAPVLLTNQVGAQDGLLFDGSSFVVAPTGELRALAASFTSDSIIYDTEHVSSVSFPHFGPGEELFMALTMGVKDYFHKQKMHKACIGLSGGIDSAVVASIAAEALGKENVLGVYLPSRFSLASSREDAYQVAKNLGIEIKEFSIEPAFQAFLHTLHENKEPNAFTVTEENLQSRCRGTLLMAISNATGSLVLNTGNKSELAMGYTTLYGDAVGAIAVLGDLVKRQVYEVAHFINHKRNLIPERVLTRAPSAELKPNQKDSDTLPEYPILDPIIEAYIVHQKSCDEIAQTLGVEKELVLDCVRKIHKNEYKRRQVPFALRVSEKAFSVGRKVPIVHNFL